MNSIVLSGNLIKNAEIKTIGNNNNTCVSFSIARNKTFKNQKGNIEKETMFFDIIFYGAYAQKIYPKLTKGTFICVEGTLNQDRWQYNNQTYSRINIIGRKIDISQNYPPQQTQESHTDSKNSINQNIQKNESNTDNYEENGIMSKNSDTQINSQQITEVIPI